MEFTTTPQCDARQLGLSVWKRDETIEIQKTPTNWSFRTQTIQFQTVCQLFTILATYSIWHELIVLAWKSCRRPFWNLLSRAVLPVVVAEHS